MPSRSTTWRAKNPAKVKAQQDRARAKRDPEYHRKYMNEWRVKNPEKAKAIGKRRRATNGPKDYALRTKYGISLSQRDEMLAAQGGCCAICGASKPGWKHDWAVDHCHVRNLVRGILCHNCNVALGHIKDDLVILRKMIHYLGG